MVCKDIEKAERLYQNYSRLLYKVALEMTKDIGLAKDAVQQTFEKAIRIAHQIRENDERATGGLLILMCKQAVAEQYHAKVKSVGELIVDDDGFEAVSHEGVWEILKEKYAEEHMRNILKWLDGKYVEPLIYRYVHELNVDEIAKMMNLNTHTIYTRLNRGRQLVKKKLAQNGGEWE